MSLSGKGRRNKGIRIERALVKVLKDTFPNASRNWSEQMERTSGRDISGTPGYCFQVKGGKMPPWRKTLDEAVQDAEGDVPVGVTRQDREPFIAHLYLTDLVHIIRKGS